MSKRNEREQRGPLTPRKKTGPAPPPFDGSLQLFGFQDGNRDDSVPDYDDSVCMCTEVASGDIAELAARGITASVGQFIISAGEDCSANQLFGPFDKMEDATEFAREKFGAERWVGTPVGF